MWSSIHDLDRQQPGARDDLHKVASQACERKTQQSFVGLRVEQFSG